MSLKKNILILCSDNYQKQPRVLRTIQALKEEFNISVAGYSDANTHAVQFIDLAPNNLKNKVDYWHFDKSLFIRLPISFYYKYLKQNKLIKGLFHENQYWSDSKKADLEQLRQNKYQLIISHGPDTLPLSIRLSNAITPVIFNAHEYYPLEFEQDPIWLKTEGAKIKYIIKKYLPKCAMMFCVSHNIQKEYQKICNINSIVISNATGYANLKANRVQKTIKIIHHGAAIRARQLEIMAEMMDYLNEDYTLHFMLVPTDVKYFEELKTKYKSHKKISFVSPVAVTEIASECNKYDIGLFILPPVNFNWLNALPNKLFEYIQGRLAIAVSPNPDMKLIVEKHNLGVVAEDYSAKAMAERIKLLSAEDIYAYKLNSEKNAFDLSAEKNQSEIIKSVKQILEE